MAKILVVDDIPDNVTLLLFNLEDDNHTVITANNGQECLEKAREHQPDVILLDMMMPIMNGPEALAKLKSDPELESIPVIMVSSNDADDDIIDTLDVGAHDYVTKPFVYPVLAARIRSAIRLKESQQALAEANKNLALLASTDSLTKSYNRRHFFHLGDLELEKAKRHNQPLSVVMLDVDYFKSINDDYGHAVGDTALIRLAELCESVGRNSDIVGRLGGEEFALCCPGTDHDGAKILAERLRQAVEDMTITMEGITLTFTISAGVVTAHEDDHTLGSLLKRADELLYKAKKSGRNCTINQA